MLLIAVTHRDQTVSIIIKMLNHTRISTLSAAIIVLLFVQFLFNDYVTGFRGQDRMIYNAFSREMGGNSRKARQTYITDGTNDVIYTERDVTGEQEVSTSSSLPCPTDCKCFYKEISWLTLNCANRSTNATSFTHEINAYLPSVAWNFTQLTLRFAPLTTVPESVCQLERLTLLALVENKLLTRLPDNCFTRLRELRTFLTVLCGLTSLQDGLFDNLIKLQIVWLQRNRISELGAHVFDVTANLPNLRTIDLSDNKLKEIDTWPVRRAQLIRYSRILLSNNRISHFTNSLGWHYDCTSAPLLNPTIDLKQNNITHLNDLLRGWNITGLFCYIHARSFVCFDHAPPHTDNRSTTSYPYQ